MHVAHRKIVFKYLRCVILLLYWEWVAPYGAKRALENCCYKQVASKEV
jgi:hypothetical protein